MSQNWKNLGHPVGKIHLSKLMLIFDTESKNVTHMVIGLKGYKSQTKNKAVHDLCWVHFSVHKFSNSSSKILCLGGLFLEKEKQNCMVFWNLYPTCYLSNWSSEVICMKNYYVKDEEVLLNNVPPHCWEALPVGDQTWGRCTCWCLKCKGNLRRSFFTSNKYFES